MREATLGDAGGLANLAASAAASSAKGGGDLEHQQAPAAGYNNGLPRGTPAPHDAPSCTAGKAVRHHGRNIRVPEGSSYMGDPLPTVSNGQHASNTRDNRVLTVFDKNDFGIINVSLKQHDASV